MAVLPYLDGAIARVLVPGLSNPDQAIPALTRAVLSPWGSAIFLAGVMAAGMSTFSAVLIITSSAIVRDLVQDGLGRRLDERTSMRASRFASVVVGLVSLAIAIKPPALVLVLMGFSWAVIASTCLWPIVFGIYWKRATRWGVLASMGGGLAASLVWMAIGSPFGLHGFVAGIVVSLISLVVVSLLTPRLPDDHVARVWGERRART
jgi:sodium/pantothenate symporter